MSPDFDRQLPPEALPRARAAAARLLSPIQRVLAIEATSGIVLVLAAIAALSWANSRWAGSYEHLWDAIVGFDVGPWSFHRPLHFWVNDGLMTMFFFVVGLEIRRETYEGELAGLRRAALPLAAALGGMLVPAAIYAALNVGRAGAAGWGIPMATDIAFAVGVLTLLGRRVPGSLRILLLALAVIDDIGAILVIAIFYTAGIAPTGLAIAGAGVAGVLGLRALGVRSLLAYAGPGLIVWIGLFRAGVHPTLAGVLLGLLTSRRDDAKRAVPFHRWVAFGIMPLFALANAGVPFGGADLGGDGWYIFLGIVVGLAAGKPIGILTASALATRTGVALRPPSTTHLGVAVVGIVGGIGFTMSLFVAHLAFPPGPMLDTAKLAILVGSAAAASLGLITGLAVLRTRAET